MLAELIDPDKIRQLIRDTDELNVLLNYEEQFDDDNIFSLAQDAEDELFANYPALVGKNIPRIAFYYYIIYMLLMSVANQENRNQMTINDNNVGTIDYSNKASQYMSLAEAYRQKADRMLQNLTASNYYKEMWGSVSSASSDFEGNFW